jgi:hypothetical protein
VCATGKKNTTVKPDGPHFIDVVTVTNLNHFVFYTELASFFFIRKERETEADSAAERLWQRL